jgi:hypothetical protein
MDLMQAAARFDELGLFAGDSLVSIIFPSESILIAESPRLDYSTTLVERSYILEQVPELVTDKCPLPSTYPLCALIGT